MEIKDGQTQEADVTLGTQEKETPKTYTEEQVEKIKTETRTSVMADVGRLRAESERALKAAQAAQERLDKIQKEQAEAELKAAQGDPEKLTQVQEKQKRQEAEAKAEKAMQDLAEREERLKSLEAREAEATKNLKAAEIANQYKVDPANLLKFTDGTPEKMEELAKILPKAEAKKPLKTDSGRMVGGTPSFEEIRAAFIKNPYDPAARARYEEALAKRNT